MATFSDIINADKPVLVDFWATWCGPCKTMAPILSDVKSKVGDKVSIIKIDVDKNPEAANAYKITGVPTLILFKAGKIVWKQSGVVPAFELLKVLNEHL